MIVAQLKKILTKVIVELVTGKETMNGDLELGKLKSIKQGFVLVVLKGRQIILPIVSPVQISNRRNGEKLMAGNLKRLKGATSFKGSVGMKNTLSKLGYARKAPLLMVRMLTAKNAMRLLKGGVIGVTLYMKGLSETTMLTQNISLNTKLGL